MAAEAVSVLDGARQPCVRSTFRLLQFFAHRTGKRAGDVAQCYFRELATELCTRSHNVNCRRKRFGNLCAQHATGKLPLSAGYRSVLQACPPAAASLATARPGPRSVGIDPSSEPIAGHDGCLAADSSGTDVALSCSGSQYIIDNDMYDRMSVMNGRICESNDVKTKDFVRPN